MDRANRLLVSASGSLLILGFLMPWLSYPLGAHGELSGLDVLRLSDTLANVGSEEGRRAARVIHLMLALVPAFGLSALALAWHHGRIGLRSAPCVAVTSAFVALAVVVVSLSAGVIAVSGDGMTLRPGLLMGLAAVVPQGAAVIRSVRSIPFRRSHRQ